MTSASVLYRQSTASASQVNSHLCACDTAFVPKLSERLNIDEYAQKIVQNAITFEAWRDGFLVGLVAAYLNDPALQSGYVTNVTVEPVLMGKDVAAVLFESCLTRARDDGFATMKLEVGQENQRAIRFYEKFGFQAQGRKNAMLQMSLNLTLENPKPSTGGTR